MFDKKSDYALNKLDADFTSEEEFLRSKDWSDGNYCEIEKTDTSYSKHTHGSSEWSGSPQSPEDAMIDAQSQKEQLGLRRLLQDGLDTCRTPVQHRRFWMYCVEALKKTSNTFFVCSLAEHMRVYDCPQGVMEGGVVA